MMLGLDKEKNTSYKNLKTFKVIKNFFLNN